MTIGECIRRCADGGFRYAGLQSGHSCFCGNRFGKHYRAREAECNTACKGNSKETCGGKLVNSVYYSGAHYVGCRTAAPVDGQPQLMNVTTDAHMTVDRCSAYCLTQGANYAYLRGGNGCVCAGTDRTVKRDDTEERCPVACVGNPSSKCGGVQSRTAVDAYLVAGVLLGCYKDKWGDRDLPRSGDGITPEDCIASCRAMKSKYAGIQDAGRCFCGDSYGRHGRVANKYCNTKCEGNPEHYCGGDELNHVYIINKVGTIPPPPPTPPPPPANPAPVVGGVSPGGGGGIGASTQPEGRTSTTRDGALHPATGGRTTEVGGGGGGGGDVSGGQAEQATKPSKATTTTKASHKHEPQGPNEGKPSHNVDHHRESTEAEQTTTTGAAGGGMSAGATAGVIAGASIGGLALIGGAGAGIYYATASTPVPEGDVAADEQYGGGENVEHAEVDREEAEEFKEEDWA
eukprot:GHVU01208445.1.p1 GENE.GHVU01208445.1~~GHVU01208445.1.p1  ORF type:complete len:540 (-),score=106.13 GHVU01208445.1:74-1450(-)